MRSQIFKLVRLVFLSMSCFMSVGCDTFSCVGKTATLSVLPGKTEVEGAIRTVSEVQEVQHVEIRAPSYGSVTRGDGQNSLYDQFSLVGLNARGTVEVQQTEKGEKLLRIYCCWMNHVPTRQEVVNARSFQDRVYNGLYKAVPGVPPISEAKSIDYNNPR